ncbi:MAG: NAD(P)/FAD-dependent oxidoreductase, partial [Gemmatimonadota bacterium]|nr:NAD(P)/FAD-dependent oxidoreductase [Gemmatimonadota bacterium]
PSFPGGNTAFARYMVKDLIPDAIDGAHGFADVMNGRVAFAALDRPGERVRIRCGATVVHVEHDASTAGERRVLVTYEKDGRPYRVAARGVVMASGGWVNQHVIRDLPAEVRSAYEHFHHVPALVVNVALTNWRFMYDLGITAAQWSGGDFGFSCNLRQPMLVGDYRPPLDPDRPTILTFYMGIYRRGLSVYEQGVAGRNELFATPFADYERRLRERMIRCFGDSGFDPERDIAGIILNRWGHARLCQQPGFYYGTDDGPSPREVVEAGFGRVAIGHSELNGHQNWTGGIRQGYRAAAQILNLL